MFCANCGLEITKQDRFCPHCGKDNRYYRPDEPKAEADVDFQSVLESAADQSLSEDADLLPGVLSENPEPAGETEAASSEPDDIESILHTVAISDLFGVPHQKSQKNLKIPAKEKEEPGYSWTKLLEEPDWSMDSERLVRESVKSASEIYAPVSGEIVAVNDDLAGDPALVNREPHAGGWLFKIKMSDPAEYDALLDLAAYKATIQK